MTDEKIVELYFDRSEQAIEETERSYGKYLHRISLGILCNEEDAKEIVNDTYLKAWNSIPPQKPDPLKGFLATITRTLSINRLEYRHAQKRNGAEYSIALDEISECIPDPDANKTNDLGELTVLIERFLRTLPDSTRRIFIRRYWYLDRISFIAESFRMSESRVKSILHRTRIKLKKELTKEGFDI